MPNKNPNHFNRTFFSEAVKPAFTSQLPIITKAIAGSDSNYIYFSTKQFSKLLILNRDTTTLGSRTINWSKDIHLESGVFSISVHQNNVTLFANNQQLIINENIDRQSSSIYRTNSRFTTGLQANEQLFLTQQSNAYINKTLFTTYLVRGNELNALYQTDQLLMNGDISTHGQLFFSSQLQLFIHVPYYHNRIVMFDSTLRIRRTFNTLDTISIASLPYIKNKFSKIIINQKSAIYKDHLFISSNLKADNESPSDYYHHIPIDVYDLSRGSYKASFYIPIQKNVLIKSMTFSPNGQLLVLFHNQVFQVFDIFNSLEPVLQ